MHATPDKAIWAVGLMAIVGLGLLCVLFYFRRTRPLGWMLSGMIVASTFGWTLVHSDRQWQPTTVVTPYKITTDYNSTVDVDRLLQPRIALSGDAAVAEHSAHPAESPSPLVTHDGRPPQPEGVAATASDGGEHTAEHSHDEVVSGSPKAPQGDAAATAQQRPAWLDPAAARSSNSYQFVLETDAHAKRQQADGQVTEEIVIKTAEVLGSLVGRPLTPGNQYGSHAYREYEYPIALHHLHKLGLTPGVIRDKVWRGEYVEYQPLELSDSSFPMVRVYTLVEYDDHFRADLQARWQQFEARARLGAVGVIAAGVLGFLGVVWGVLKFDTATKGYYTKWLLVGGGAVTMVVVGLFLALA